MTKNLQHIRVCTIFFLSEEEKVWKMHGPATKQNGRRTRFCIGNLFLCTQNISNLIVFPSYQIGLEIVQAVDVARVVGLETFSPRLTHDWPRILNGSLTDFLSVIGSLHVVSSHSYLVNPVSNLPRFVCALRHALPGSRISSLSTKAENKNEFFIRRDVIEIRDQLNDSKMWSSKIQNQITKDNSTIYQCEISACASDVVPFERFDECRSVRDEGRCVYAHSSMGDNEMPDSNKGYSGGGKSSSVKSIFGYMEGL